MSGLTADPSLLEVENLRVHFPTRSGPVEAVSDVSLKIGEAEAVAVVGESGCGKSVTALSIMGLLGNGSVTGGAIRFRGEDLLAKSEEELREIRGAGIAMVFQDPMNSLDPLFSIGSQVVEALRSHRAMSRAEAKRRAVELLGEVLIPDPARSARKHPHELSGGQCQRVMVAMALACSPALLIADEPTTALDVTVEAEVLQLIRTLGKEHQAALLLVTHDMGIVAEMADRVVVMYAGKVVEEGHVDQVLTDPQHPYTQALLASTPRPTMSREQPLPAIAGSVPSLFQMPSGCRFHPRCPHAAEQCRSQEPPLLELPGRRLSRCWLRSPLFDGGQESVPAGERRTV